MDQISAELEDERRREEQRLEREQAWMTGSGAGITVQPGRRKARMEVVDLEPNDATHCTVELITGRFVHLLHPMREVCERIEQAKRDAYRRVPHSPPGREPFAPISREPQLVIFRRDSTQFQETAINPSHVVAIYPLHAVSENRP